MKGERLLCQINELRRELDSMIGNPSCSAEERLAVSQRLDRLILRYQKLLAGQEDAGQK